MKTYWRKLPVVSIVACVVATVFLFTLLKTEKATSENDFGLLRSSLVEAIQNLGPAEAYASMKRNYAGRDVDMQHNVAHVFGESLYAVIKKEGIGVCDTAFNFGCYHGFFTAAVKTEGIKSVSVLDGVCQESSKPNVCQHGLGHGILEYLGHNNLSQALERCSLTYQPDPIAGCTSGVFMEYNVPLTTDGTVFLVSARPLEDPEKPYAPCTDVEEKFRDSCYHELPQWWNQVYGGDFERMGFLCGAAPAPDYKHCFAGIGNIAGSSAGYSAENTIGLCALMPREGVDICLQNAAWGFMANAGDRSGGEKICRSLTKNDPQDCLSSL